MKKANIRRVLCAAAVLCCMMALSVTAFADGSHYASDESGGSTPPSSIDSITISTENVKLSESQDDEPLTPEGNLSLIDDISQTTPYASEESELENKQFITVQSKSGNYFYIVIDRSGDADNVHFLNLVDEADLMALLEDGEDSAISCSCADKCEAGAVNTACAVCKSNLCDCTGAEKAVEKQAEPDTDTEAANTDKEEKDSGKKSGSGLVVVVLLLLLAGGGALYWFKLRKPKPDTRGSADLDDYDYGEEEDDDDYDEEYESEDESEATEDENA